MPEHDQQDLVTQIDTLTDDAASWTANGDHTQPWWATAEPGALAVIALDMTGARPMQISATNMVRDIARHVGEPFFGLDTGLRKVMFLVGVDSSAGQPVNTGATQMLHQLLADVRDGHYIASDAERDHARHLLDTPDITPAIHGSCLVTGSDDGAPAPLDDNFQVWFSDLLAEMAARRRAKFSAAVADAIGIPLEELGNVVLIDLG